MAQILIIVCFLSVTPLLIGYAIRTAIQASKKPPEQPYTFGSAHFATLKEARRAGFLPSAKQLESGMTYLPLGDMQDNIQHFWKWFPVALSEKRQESHVLLVAPNGRGKTSGIIIPGLLSEVGRRSLFINDVKCELVNKCAGWLSQYHDCVIFSPTRPEESHYYNPLVHVKNMEDAEALAQCIVANTGESSEAFWNNAAKLLLTATILHLTEAKRCPPFSALVDMLCGMELPRIKDTLLHSPSRLAGKVATSFTNSLSQNDKLAGSVLGELAARLFPMYNPDIVAVTADDELDFTRFLNEPTAIFLSIPASDAKRLKWLSSCLIMQLMKYLTKAAEREPGERLPRGAVLYLDEFGNQVIPHFPEYISLVRSAGISLIMAVQSHDQIEAAYGEHDKGTILANGCTHIVFPGCGLPECSYYSERLGDTTVQAQGTGYAGLDTTYSTTQARRPLMTPDEIRRMPDKQLLLISENAEPLTFPNTPYFEWSTMQTRVNLPFTRPSRKPTPQAAPPAPPPQEPPQQHFMP